MPPDKADTAAQGQETRDSERTVSNDTASAATSSGGPGWLAITRRICAALLAAGSVGVAFASYWVSAFTICRPINGGPNFTQVTNCNPWTLQDLLPALIIVGLLLLPDVTEVNVFNLISLKREIKAAKAEADVVRAQQEALEARISAQLSQVSSQQMELHNHVHYPSVPPENLSQSIDEKLEKIEDEVQNQPKNHGFPPVEAGSESGKSSEQQKPDLDSREAASSRVSGSGRTRLEDMSSDTMSMRLLLEWEKLSEYLKMGRVSGNSLGVRHANSTRTLFMSLFKDEIDTVRAVRNSIAHGKKVPQDALEGAYAAAVRLNGIIGTRASLEREQALADEVNALKEILDRLHGSTEG